MKTSIQSWICEFRIIIITFSSFFSSAESRLGNHISIDSDTWAKWAVFMSDHSFVVRRAVTTSFLVLAVLSVSHQPQVTKTIISFISIFMINLPFRRNLCAPKLFPKISVLENFFPVKAKLIVSTTIFRAVNLFEIFKITIVTTFSAGIDFSTAKFNIVVPGNYPMRVVSLTQRFREIIVYT